MTIPPSFSVRVQTLSTLLCALLALDRRKVVERAWLVRAASLPWPSRHETVPAHLFAHQLEQWQDVGVDGVNQIIQYFPQSAEDFVEHVIPVLQERGLAQKEYGSGTLRERMFPEIGPRLPDRHAAARYRGAFVRDVEVSGEGGTNVTWDTATHASV